MTLAKCYPGEFDNRQIRDFELPTFDNFIIHMRGGNPKFSNLQEIHDLTRSYIEANLMETYSLIYLLVKLILTLPVATITMGRAFSCMRHIKNEAQNSIDD